MRIYLLTFFLLTPFITLMAQKPATSFPGYVITSDGEKIEGDIRRGVLQATGEYSSVVMDPPKGKKLKFQAEGLEGYEFDNLYYKKFILESGTHLLMREEHTGQVNLYYGEIFIGGEGNPQFLLEKGDKVIELNEKSYKDELKALILKYPDYHVLLARAEYELDAIRDIISSYNSWAARFDE